MAPSAYTLQLMNWFNELMKIYLATRTNIALALLDERGELIEPLKSRWLIDSDLMPSDRRRLLEESMRWGEPSVIIDARGYYIWAVPLTVNTRLIGGIAGTFECGSEAHSAQISSAEVYSAAHDLLRTSIDMGFTNGPMLKENRRNAEYEASKATAIHGLKESMYTSVRQMYMKEEEQLKGAIRSGDRRAAREVLNRILLGVYAVGSQDLDLLKAVVLEFIVVIYRIAVDAGGDAMEMLGLNYRSYLALYYLQNDTQLSYWLVDHLEQMMDSLKLIPDRPVETRLQDILNYIREHFTEDISRESVAGRFHITQSYLSHIIRERLATTFTDIVTELRISKAKELLLRSDKGLSQIAVESGFSDQSYFTKVFHRKLGMTPKEYRLTQRNRTF